MEEYGMLTALTRTAALTAILAGGVAAAASAQATAADPHHPDATLAQATPPAGPGDAGGQGQGAQPAQPGMTPPGMGMDMMGGMMQPGATGAMPMMRTHGHMIKVMFAVADLDGDGGLSFEEVTTVHRRIFDAVDADGDGKVTPEEVQAFMQP